MNGLSSLIRHADKVRHTASSSAPGRSALAASWRRSLLHHNLDPDDPHRPDRLTDGALLERRDMADRLIYVARPTLDRLAAAAMNTGSAVILSGPDGVILEHRIRDADHDHFRQSGLTEGANWSEASEGTNGIGTCLAEKRPVVIWADQHFHSRNIALTCMSAPIEAPDGSWAGVVDMSSCRRDMTEAQAKLIALTVQDAALRISCDLFSATYSHARVIVIPAQDPSHGPCQIAVDDDDLILACNRAAQRTFDLHPNDIARHLPVRDFLHPAAAGRSDLAGALRSELQRALQRAGGNMSKAARDLRIGRATLYRKLKRLGLTADRQG